MLGKDGRRARALLDIQREIPVNSEADPNIEAKFILQEANTLALIEIANQLQESRQAMESWEGDELRYLRSKLQESVVDIHTHNNFNFEAPKSVSLKEWLAGKWLGIQKHFNRKISGNA